jgi:cbb3-type cytochrome oxidase subunit 3
MSLDSYGIAGMAMTYGTLFFFTLAALIVFISFYMRGKLGMDEEAKWKMMEKDDE